MNHISEVDFNINLVYAVYELNTIFTGIIDDILK